MTQAGIEWVKLTTVVLFVSFVLMCIILYLPSRHKPYKDAEKIALKDGDDEPITPRHHEEKNHERTNK